jgi:quercetin dioxygenase-like cupin family protein
MKFVQIAISLLAAISAEGADFGTPLTPVDSLPKISGDVITIPADSAAVKAMSEWDVLQTARGEQTGQRILISENGVTLFGSIPDDASKYEARSHKYPMGAVRILSWDKGSGPVVHQVTFETELFILQGEVDMELQGGEKIRLDAGDAVSLPAGVLRNMNPSDDTVIVQYFVGNTAENPNTEVVRGAEQKQLHFAQWMDDGEAKSAVEEEDRRNAPPGAAQLSLKVYPFAGNSIRHVNLAAGGTSNPATYAVDVLIYIVKGRMKRTEGDQTFEVSAGDTVRESKGQTGYWEILEDSEFISTNAPIDPAKPAASR